MASVADAKPLLPAEECKGAAQFQQEGFEFADQGLFEIVLGVFVVQVRELQVERILEFILRRRFFSGFRDRALLEHRLIVVRTNGRQRFGSVSPSLPAHDLIFPSASILM